MSYRKPLLIQNRPGQGIAKAAADAGNAIGTAIVDNITAEAEEQKLRDERIELEQATQNAQDVKDAIAKNEENSQFAEDAESTRANLGEDFNANNEDIYSLTRTLRNSDELSKEQIDGYAKQLVDARGRNQQLKDFIGGVAADSEESNQYQEGKLSLAGGAMEKAYNGFLNKLPGYSLKTERVDGKMSVSVVTPDDTYELPYASIADGSFSPYVVTPDIFKGTDKVYQDFNKSVKSRSGDEGENNLNQSDADGMTNVFNSQVSSISSRLLGMSQGNIRQFEVALKSNLGFSEEEVKQYVSGLSDAKTNSEYTQKLRDAVGSNLKPKIALNTGLSFKEGKFEVPAAEVDASKDSNTTNTILNDQYTQAQQVKMVGEIDTRAEELIKGNNFNMGNMAGFFGLSSSSKFFKGKSMSAADDMAIDPSNKTITFSFYKSGDPNDATKTVFDLTKVGDVMELLSATRGIDKEKTRAIANKIAKKIN